VKKVPRIQRERERRQRDFLEAAEEVFSRRGFHNATIQEISERSEFGAGSIYHMFENKDEIYLALIRMRREEYLSGLKERLRAAPDPLSQIRAFIGWKIAFFCEHKQFVRLFVNTSVAARWSARAGLAEELINAYEEYLSFLADIFSEGIEKDLFSVKDPIALALSVEGIINALLSYWVQHEGEDRPLPSVETVEEILFQGVLRKGRRT